MVGGGERDHPNPIERRHESFVHWFAGTCSLARPVFSFFSLQDDEDDSYMLTPPDITPPHLPDGLLFVQDRTIQPSLLGFFGSVLLHSPFSSHPPPLWRRQVLLQA